MTVDFIFPCSGKFHIYIDTHQPKTPWVIRYPDPGSIHGFNELRVASWSARGVNVKDYTDPFNEARIGKWMVEIPDCDGVFDRDSLTVVFLPREASS